MLEFGPEPQKRASVPSYAQQSVSSAAKRTTKRPQTQTKRRPSKIANPELAAHLNAMREITHHHCLHPAYCEYAKPWQLNSKRFEKCVFDETSPYNPPLLDQLAILKKKQQKLTEDVRKKVKEIKLYGTDPKSASRAVSQAVSRAASRPASKSSASRPKRLSKTGGFDGSKWYQKHDMFAPNNGPEEERGMTPNLVESRHLQRVQMLLDEDERQERELEMLKLEHDKQQQEQRVTSSESRGSLRSALSSRGTHRSGSRSVTWTAVDADSVNV